MQLLQTKTAISTPLGKEETAAVQPTHEAGFSMSIISELGSESNDTDDREELFSQVKAELLDTIFPTGSSHYNNRDAREIRGARFAARKYILAKNIDKKEAFWEVFKKVYRTARYDTWAKAWESRGKVTTLANMLTDLEGAIAIASPMPSEMFQRKAHQWQQTRGFNPVAAYLDSLRAPDDEAKDLFNSLAYRLFGKEDELSRGKVTRWLIGAVARAMKPGEKMDNVLVIQGAQGIGKTDMLEALFSERFFRTSRPDLPLAEQIRIMQQAWGVEMGEIEATFRQKDISQLKAFITAKSDDLRRHHVNDPDHLPRHCVFAGTTNQREFLNDPTGSRRFWVIDAGEKALPVSWVRENRDAIWAVAYVLYCHGMPWWMTDTEAKLSEHSNSAFQNRSPFEERLGSFLGTLQSYNVAISAMDVAHWVLGIAPERFRQNSRDVASALEALGYVRKQLKSKAMTGYFYIRPEAGLIH